MTRAPSERCLTLTTPTATTPAARPSSAAPATGTTLTASVAAQELNNADPVYELIDGRCSYDGLPEGNCAHFPGEQAVVAPDGTAYVEGSVKLDENGIPVHARPEHGARQPAGPDYPARTDKEANATTAKARGEGSGTEPRKS